MKITVVGLGYVGLSNAVLLAQHNEVIGVDIDQDRVDAVNAKNSPIVDAEQKVFCQLIVSHQLPPFDWSTLGTLSLSS